MIKELLENAQETLTVRRVFGEPYERDGLTCIPVASVQGGGGGGQGDSPGGAGSGGGFGMVARPAGVYVIRGTQVSWQPAVDVNRIVAGAQIVAVVALLTIRAIVKARTKAR